MARKKLYYLPDDIIKRRANSNEWMFEDGIEYRGWIHIYKSTGEVYSESKYIDGVSKPLIPYVDLDEINNKLVDEYNVITGNRFVTNYENPIPFIPRPNEKDFGDGFVKRYIVCKFNSPLQIIEVNSKNYPKIDPVLYIKKEFEWRIGKIRYVPIEVIRDTNKRTVDFLKIDIPQLPRFLNNLTQFSV